MGGFQTCSRLAIVLFVLAFRSNCQSWGRWDKQILQRGSVEMYASPLHGDMGERKWSAMIERKKKEQRNAETWSRKWSAIENRKDKESSKLNRWPLAITRSILARPGRVIFSNSLSVMISSIGSTQESEPLAPKQRAANEEKIYRKIGEQMRNSNISKTGPVVNKTWHCGKHHQTWWSISFLTRLRQRWSDSIECECRGEQNWPQLDQVFCGTKLWEAQPKLQLFQKRSLQNKYKGAKLLSYLSFWDC